MRPGTIPFSSTTSFSGPSTLPVAELVLNQSATEWVLASFCVPDTSLLEESRCVGVQWCLSPQIAPGDIHHICEGICVSPSSGGCSLLNCSGSSSAEQEKQRKSIQTHLALVSWVTKVVCLDTHDQARLSQGTWALKTRALAAYFLLSKAVMAHDNDSSSVAWSLGQTQSLTRKGFHPPRWVFILKFMDTRSAVCRQCSCALIYMYFFVDTRDKTKDEWHVHNLYAGLNRFSIRSIG